MFSGIIETTVQVRSAQPREGVIQISVDRPAFFDELKVGDSIAIDGVCLTLESFDHQSLRFALGPETLRVTGWTIDRVLGREVNAERSLRLGDRIHGHLVSGHVDAQAKVLDVRTHGETLSLLLENPKAIAHYIWPKGSIAVNGVSLTINLVGEGSFQVGLIPETLKRTNLGKIKVGDHVNLEADNWARGLVHWAEHKAGQ